MSETDEPYTDADRDKPRVFWNTRLEIKPCCNVTREFAEIMLWFKTDRNLSETDAVYFDLPSEFVGAEGWYA